jgi:hypothetical protein
VIKKRKVTLEEFIAMSPKEHNALWFSDRKHYRRLMSKLRHLDEVRLTDSSSDTLNLTVKHNIE